MMIKVRYYVTSPHRTTLRSQTPTSPTLSSTDSSSSSAHIYVRLYTAPDDLLCSFLGKGSSYQRLDSEIHFLCISASKCLSG